MSSRKKNNLPRFSSFINIKRFRYLNSTVLLVNVPFSRSRQKVFENGIKEVTRKKTSELISEPFSMRTKTGQVVNKTRNGLTRYDVAA